MKDVDGRIAAQLDLLGTSELPNSSDEYPETITLPGYVHNRAQEAVTMTAHDFRERSINFKFRRSHWTDGLMMKGSLPTSIRDSSTSIAHALITKFTKPHIDLHTHPILNEYHIENEWLRSSRLLKVLGLQLEAFEATKLEERLAFLNQTAGIPSVVDAKLFNGMLYKPAAWMVASEAGYFLCVTDLNNSGASLMKPLNGGLSEEQVCDSIQHEEDRQSLSDRIKTLNSNFVTYASTNHESTKLTRI